MSHYTIRYNKASNHIQGLDEATEASADGMTYAVSACGSLSRSGSRMAVGQSYETVSEALGAARVNAQVGRRKLCKHCEKAAQRLIG